jgi:hypothetical protein
MLQALLTGAALGVVALAGPRAVAAPPLGGMPAALTPEETTVPAEYGGSWANVAAVSLSSIGTALVLRRRRRR